MMKLLTKLLRAIEPWYDWGLVGIERMEGTIDIDHLGGEGEVRFVQLQWFGVHVGLQLGRTPPRFPR